MSEIHLNQIELVTGIVTLIEKMAKEQGDDDEGEGLCIHTRQFNEIIKAANIIKETMATPFKHAEPNSGLKCWLTSDEVGTSSKFLAYTLSGMAELKTEYAYPRDVSDFVRCRKMLSTEPSLTPKLYLIASSSEIWASIFRNWDEICQAIDEERLSDASKMIQAKSGTTIKPI